MADGRVTPEASSAALDRWPFHRMTSITNGFSKKLKTTPHAFAIHMMYDNVCHSHQTLSKVAGNRFVAAVHRPSAFIQRRARNYNTQSGLRVAYDLPRLDSTTPPEREP